MPFLKIAKALMLVHVQGTAQKCLFFAQERMLDINQIQAHTRQWIKQKSEPALWML